MEYAVLIHGNPNRQATALVAGQAQEQVPFLEHDDPASITMGGPITEAATFTHN